MTTSANVHVSRGHGLLRTADGARQWRVAYTASATTTKSFEGGAWVGGQPDLKAVVDIEAATAHELSSGAVPLELQLENGQWVACVMVDGQGTLRPRAAAPEPQG
jgi:hypothetical protein